MKKASARSLHDPINRNYHHSSAEEFPPAACMHLMNLLSRNCVLKAPLKSFSLVKLVLKIQITLQTIQFLMKTHHEKYELFCFQALGALWLEEMYPKYKAKLDFSFCTFLHYKTMNFSWNNFIHTKIFKSIIWNLFIEKHSLKCLS